jgi:G3E family GTPase
VPAPRSPDRAALPVTVLSGFLGAGKTTLLRRLLREQSGRRIATIVNDLSDLPVDAELVQDAREGRNEIIIDLHGGSIGGALRDRFLETLDTLSTDETIDHVLVETSGSTHPGVLVHDLTTHPSVRLDTFATVVDGLNLLRDYDGGAQLLAARSIAPSSTAALLRAQIEIASVLLVSKADRLSRAEAQALLSVLQRLNPRALLITMAFGRVDPSHLIGADSWGARRGSRMASRLTAPSAMDASATDTATPPEPDDPARFDLGSITLRDVRPFHPERLHTLFCEGLPLGVHRSKGWLWLASRPLDVLVWSQAGSHIGLEWAATWKAGILADPEARLLPEERRGLEAQMRALHPTFGDRHCELTLIGHTRDRTHFAELLRECLCTEAEIAAWQRGAPFADPWPRSLRRV